MALQPSEETGLAGTGPRVILSHRPRTPPSMLSRVGHRAGSCHIRTAWYLVRADHQEELTRTKGAKKAVARRRHFGSGKASSRSRQQRAADAARSAAWTGGDTVVELLSNRSNGESLPCQRVAGGHTGGGRRRLKRNRRSHH